MTLGFLAETQRNENNEALKQQLFDSVCHGKSQVSEIARTFYGKEQQTKEDYLAFSDAIVAEVDRVLEAGDWNDSLFLRNTVKPLEDIREEALNLQEQVRLSSGEQKLTLRDLEDDEVLVYISVFQSEGHNIKRWELQLNSLRRHLLGRPVYENEEDVRKVIRQKLIQISEAYVAVAIKRSDIQNFAHQVKRVDRRGNTLLTLKESAVQPENIFKFVHQEEQYYFSDSKLVLV